MGILGWGWVHGVGGWGALGPPPVPVPSAAERPPLPALLLVPRVFSCGGASIPHSSWLEFY